MKNSFDKKALRQIGHQLSPVVMIAGNGLTPNILDDIDEQDYKSILEKVKPLSEFVKKHIKGVSQNDLYFWQEFVLWSLVEYKKLSKYRYAEGVQFKDPYGNFISGL